MKIRAAVLEEIGREGPYAVSRPLRVQEIDLEGPGPGEVMIKMVADLLGHSGPVASTHLTLPTQYSVYFSQIAEPR